MKPQPKDTWLCHFCLTTNPKTQSYCKKCGRPSTIPPQGKS